MNKRGSGVDARCFCNCVHHRTDKCGGLSEMKSKVNATSSYMYHIAASLLIA